MSTQSEGRAKYSGGIAGAEHNPAIMLDVRNSLGRFAREGTGWEAIEAAHSASANESGALLVFEKIARESSNWEGEEARRMISAYNSATESIKFSSSVKPRGRVMPTEATKPEPHGLLNSTSGIRIVEEIPPVPGFLGRLFRPRTLGKTRELAVRSQRDNLRLLETLNQQHEVLEQRHKTLDGYREAQELAREILGTIVHYWKQLVSAIEDGDGTKAYEAAEMIRTHFLEPALGLHGLQLDGLDSEVFAVCIGAPTPQVFGNPVKVGELAGEVQEGEGGGDALTLSAYGLDTVEELEAQAMKYARKSAPSAAAVRELARMAAKARQ